MRKHRIASLFSGAGGLDLGFVQTGRYEVIFANEKLEEAAKTYSNNIRLRLAKCDGINVEAEKGAILVCDVEKVYFDRLREDSVDIVIGAPPCQDFSVIRGPNRRGVEVKRGRLYAHFVRALVALQPKVFLFENVPGLINANEGLAYKVILEDFKSLNLRWDEVKKVISVSNYSERIEGYEILFAGRVDFSRLGVPQKRQRLIVIGIRKDLIRTKSEFLQHLQGKLKSLLQGRKWLFYKYPLTAVEAFEGMPLDMLSDKYREVMLKWAGMWDEVRAEVAKMWKMKVWDQQTFNVIEDYLNANAIKAESSEELEEAFKQHEAVLKELGYYGRPISSLDPADFTNEPPKIRKSVIERLRKIPPGENHMFVKGTPWEVKGGNINLIYKRLHPLKPSYTITAYGGGGTYGYHYDRDRTQLTLREKARLQTFPDHFLFYGKKTEIRSQIGEAVPPLVAKRIAEFLAFEILDLLLEV